MFDSWKSFNLNKNPFLYFRYYVCYGQPKPERYSCPNGLGFDVHNGVCDYPRQYDVDDVIMMHPTKPNEDVKKILN